MSAAKEGQTTRTQDSANARELKEIDRELAALDDKTTVPFVQLESVSAAELDKLEIPPIDWLVKDLLPVGLAMLSAPPKYFKSFMCLDLCVSICTGSPFLNHETEQNGCLYLDLESTQRRPQDRLNKICGTNQKKPDNLFIIAGDQKILCIGEGFEEQIAAQLNKHPDIRLVVIDVVQLIRPEKRNNQSGYDRDYADYHALKMFADDHNICLLLVSHNRKMKDPTDPFNEISGSAATMGSLDCAWTITKKDRYDEDAIMSITGRDLESKQLKIRYNNDLFRWEYMGTTDDIEEQEAHCRYMNNPIIQTIKLLVATNNGYWEGAAQDIKNASKSSDYEIFDDTRVIGKKITEYEAMLHADGIQHIYDPTGKRGIRLHKFSKINVDDVDDVAKVDDVVDVDATYSIIEKMFDDAEEIVEF